MTFVDVTDLNRFGEEIEFDDADGQWFNSGRFVELFLQATVPGSPTGQIGRLVNALNALSTRWNSALTLCAKIDWFHDQRGDGEKLPNLVLMEFMANDISSFFGEVRAVFDCIRDVLRTVFPAIKGKSFSGLRIFVTEAPSSAADSIGSDLVALIAKCEWFQPLKDVRDALVHRHTKLLVYPFEERIKFNLMYGPNDLISDPELLTDEGLVDFHYFAAAVLSRIYCLMEDMATIASNRTQLPQVISKGQSVYFAFGTVRGWMIELLEHIEGMHEAEG